MRVLLVEDDEPVAESLRRGLTRYGFEVEWVTTGGGGTEPRGPVRRRTPRSRPARHRRPRRLQGAARARRRADHRDQRAQRRDGPGGRPGARRGRLRVQAVRGARGHRADTSGDAARAAPTARCSPAERPGPVRLPPDHRPQGARRVRLDGEEVALAPKEYDLLAFLTEEPGALMSREQIMEAVWDANWFGPDEDAGRACGGAAAQARRGDHHRGGQGRRLPAGDRRGRRGPHEPAAHPQLHPARRRGHPRCSPCRWPSRSPTSCGTTPNCPSCARPTPWRCCWATVTGSPATPWSKVAKAYGVGRPPATSR